MSQRKCNGKSKRTGERCGANAMTGSEKCYHHGGKSPVGTAAAQFKTGRYSKYLPARLAGRYEESSRDTELLALREEVSLVDSRLADLLKRVDTNEAGHWWKEMQRVHRDYLDAQEAKDVPAMSKALREWGRILHAGVSDYAAWNEVYNVLEQRRKLVESERKRLVEMQQMITSERAMLLIGALVDVVKRHVSDRSILAAISADVGRLITIDSA